MLTEKTGKRIADELKRLADILEQTRPIMPTYQPLQPMPNFNLSQCGICGGYHGALMCPRLQPTATVIACACGPGQCAKQQTCGVPCASFRGQQDY